MVISREMVRRVAMLTLGWVFILLGVIGLVLPLLQGVLLILVGLYILSRESRTARKVLLRLRHRFPRLDRELNRAKQWFRRLGSRSADRDPPGR
jgi:uncharacterized membrane protein YbaN (DUF454 family)